MIRYLKATGRIRAPLPASRAGRIGEMIFWWIPERWRAPALASLVLVVALSALSIASGSFVGMVGKGTIAAKDVYIDAHRTLTEVRVLDEVPGDIEKDMKTAKTLAGAVYLLLAVSRPDIHDSRRGHDPRDHGAHRLVRQDDPEKE